MSTRRTSDGPSGGQTKRSDDSGGTAKPRGVRPPARTVKGVSGKTAVSGDHSNAPTRFSKATQVYSGGSPQSGSPRVKTGGKMTGGQTQLAGAIGTLPEDAISEDQTAMQDPVHAWFVIVDGPGRGNSVKIGAGRSSIGRGAEEHVILNFGDESISREKHAWVTFDDRVSKFYISAGDGRNLCYVNDEPVLTSLEIKDRDTIMIGKTSLIFIAFCGAEFSWTEG